MSQGQGQRSVPGFRRRCDLVRTQYRPPVETPLTCGNVDCGVARGGHVGNPASVDPATGSLIRPVSTLEPATVSLRRWFGGHLGYAQGSAVPTDLSCGSRPWASGGSCRRACEGRQHPCERSPPRTEQGGRSTVPRSEIKQDESSEQAHRPSVADEVSREPAACWLASTECPTGVPVKRERVQVAPVPVNDLVEGAQRYLIVLRAVIEARRVTTYRLQTTRCASGVRHRRGAHRPNGTCHSAHCGRALAGPVGAAAVDRTPRRRGVAAAPTVLRQPQAAQSPFNAALAYS